MDDNDICRVTAFAHSLSTALEERDSDTRLHSDRVVDIAMEIGRRCGMSRDELSLLWLSAAFHDVGKIAIPDHVLRKPGSLDGMEWETMKSHSTVGEKIMRAIKVPGMDWVADAVRHHHECYDGSGYPDGLASGEIPIMARIVAIADGYDAMVMERSYHAAMAHEQVMDHMRDGAGEKYDPDLFGHFEAAMAKARTPSA
jgi:HD-GYP domain-containing protein (c-di-GMP phosphodiesterase class II)